MLRPTAIKKLKSNKGYKCRLCISGDQHPEAVADFVSAPTSAREYAGVAIVLVFNDTAYVFKTADVSRVFTQSDYYNRQDRVRAELPKYARTAPRMVRRIIFGFSRIGSRGPIWKANHATAAG